jgi:hypothetical protein
MRQAERGPGHYIPGLLAYFWWMVAASLVIGALGMI